MEREVIEAVDKVRIEFLLGSRISADALHFTPIGIISEDGIPLMLQVDSNLVGSSGFQMESQIRGVPEGLDDLISRDSVLTALADHRKALAVAGMPAQLGFDHPFIRANFAPDDSAILALDFASGKLVGQFAMHVVVFGDDKQAGSAFIQPMHDSRPHIMAGVRLSEMMEQGIDQRSREIAMSGVRNHAGGFVDHEQVRVFVIDIECDRFRENVGRGLLAKVNLDQLIAADFLRFPRNFAVEKDQPRIDQFVDFIARNRRESLLEITVNPNRMLTRRSLELIWNWECRRVAHGQERTSFCVDHTPKK